MEILIWSKWGDVPSGQIDSWEEIKVSTTIIFSENLYFVQDHTASCIQERERVIKAGGAVTWRVNTWRVGAAAIEVIFRHPLPLYNLKHSNVLCRMGYCKVLSVSLLWVPKAIYLHVGLNMVLTNVDTTCGKILPKSNYFVLNQTAHHLYNALLELFLTVMVIQFAGHKVNRRWWFEALCDCGAGSWNVHVIVWWWISGMDHLIFNLCCVR